MYKYYEEFMRVMNESYAGTWKWFNGLDRQSWLYVLAITTLAGLLCMRGYGSRNNY